MLFSRTEKMKGRLLRTILIMLLFTGGQGQAQYDAYRTGTRINLDEDSSSGQPQSGAQGLMDRAENDTTNPVFGRPAGTGSSPSPEGKQYVNLNPETAFGPEVITSFDFPDTSLIDLTKHMQELTGINLILDKDLKGKVSILSPAPITVGDAWKAYLTALNINGYTLVKSGAFYKIVQARDIRYTPTKIYTGSFAPDTENYVMKIIPLKNINSTEVTRSFRPFMSRYGRIIDIRQTNTVIVQDTGSNINRLNRLIKFIDVPGHEEALQIFRVQHSSAPEIAKLLDQILRDSGSGARGPRQGAAPRPIQSSSGGEATISKIIAEPRTNSIIAMANSQGAVQLRTLIEKLDVPHSAATAGQIHVYYLNHGDAETLAQTLSSIISSANPGAGGTRRPTGSRFTGNQPGADGESLFTDEVRVTADKDNNAIVVTASPTDYLTIRDVIRKLDVPRDQVYVEGMMMETQVNRNSALGVSIIGAYGSGNAQRAGFTGGNNDLVNLLSGSFTSLGGLFAGAGVGSKVTVQGPNGQDITVNSINGLISALASNGTTNVLATPQILALDNTEGVFEVGEQIPTPETTNTASGSTQRSIRQQKVALTLKITPQINKVTRFIRLKIDQKIEDFSQRALPDGVASEGVATTLRSIVTTVTVRDQDTIAMGGLMRDRESSTVNKVPLLGDIPVLGWLFKNTRKTTEKVNLLLFLTPRILANQEEETAATLQDVLNRRNAHLKDVLGNDDPFNSTARALYDKAIRQKEGPLYNEEEAMRYRQENEQYIQEQEIQQGSSNIRADATPPDVPDYNALYQEISSKQSATQKVHVEAIDENQ
jgi:general secretion pathway protein D